MQLTRSEEQVMQILWGLGEGLVKDILDKFDDPKPARNTVSTVVRILEKRDLSGTRIMAKCLSIIRWCKRKSIQASS